MRYAFVRSDVSWAPGQLWASFPPANSFCNHLFDQQIELIQRAFDAAE